MQIDKDTTVPVGMMIQSKLVEDRPKEPPRFEEEPDERLQDYAQFEPIAPPPLDEPSPPQPAPPEPDPSQPEPIQGEIGSFEFDINIYKGPGDAIGIDVDGVDLENLRVNRIKPGLVSKWNEQNPNQEVREGDCLKEINGVRGNRQQLLEQIKSSKNMAIVVLREKS